MKIPTALPCLAYVGEDAPNPAEMCKGGEILKGPTCSEEKGRGKERKDCERDDWEMGTGWQAVIKI